MADHEKPHAEEGSEEDHSLDPLTLVNEALERVFSGPIEASQEGNVTRITLPEQPSAPNDEVTPA